MKRFACCVRLGLLAVSMIFLLTTALAQSAQPQNDAGLPWKPVAAPQGVLPADTYAAKIKNFGRSDEFLTTKKTVEDLLDNTIRTIMPSPLLKQKDLHIALHVVEFGDTAANPANQNERNLKINSSAWYLYHKDVSFEEFTGQRIYGSRNVIVLFLHLNAKGLSKNNAKDKLLSNNATSNAQNELKLWALGDGAVESIFADVHYEAAVVKKTAANIQSFLSVLKILGVVSRGGQNGPKTETENVIVWGSGAITNIAVPSDVHLAGYATAPIYGSASPSEEKRIGSEVAFDNEGRYLWDVSIGIPVHKIKEVQYSSSAGTVEAKQVEKQNAYAMFNLMPWPVDIKDPKSNLVPRILLGFPLGGDPWSKLFAGCGIGLPKYMAGSQFFVGVVFNRVSMPSTLTAGASASEAELQNNSRLQMEKKLVVGINVPVKSIMDKLLNK